MPTYHRTGHTPTPLEKGRMFFTHLSMSLEEGTNLIVPSTALVATLRGGEDPWLDHKQHQNLILTSLEVSGIAYTRPDNAEGSMKLSIDSEKDLAGLLEAYAEMFNIRH